MAGCPRRRVILICHALFLIHMGKIFVHNFFTPDFVENSNWNFDFDIQNSKEALDYDAFRRRKNSVCGDFAPHSLAAPQFSGRAIYYMADGRNHVQLRNFF